jgi:hypothetical protein
VTTLSSNPADVPFDGPNDKTLKDKEKLQGFADTLAKQCKIPAKKVTWEDRMYLRMYLEATKGKNTDANASKNIVSFIISHEIGHVHCGHAEKKTALSKKLSQRKYIIINALTLGIFKKIAQSTQSQKHEKEADEAAFKMSKSNAEGGIRLFSTVHNFKSVGAIEKAAYTAFTVSDFFTHGAYKKRLNQIRAYQLTQNLSAEIL